VISDELKKEGFLITYHSSLITHRPDATRC
jgi:hypothetical protein